MATCGAATAAGATTTTRCRTTRPRRSVPHDRRAVDNFEGLGLKSLETLCQGISHLSLLSVMPNRSGRSRQQDADGCESVGRGDIGRRDVNEDSLEAGSDTGTKPVTREVGQHLISV